MAIYDNRLYNARSFWLFSWYVPKVYNLIFHNFRGFIARIRMLLVTKTSITVIK